MEHISATEAKQAFAAVLDKAQREPVIIRKQNRDVAVMMSVQDYERMRRLNIQEFQSFRIAMGEKARARGLTDDILQDLLKDDDAL